MPSPYKRRRPSLVKNFWVYRRLIVMAMVLGLLLWFIWVNNAARDGLVPLQAGEPDEHDGPGDLAERAWSGRSRRRLTMTMVLALRRRRGGAGGRDDDEDRPPAIPEDRPPPDYAAKATEGFPDARSS